MFKPIKVSSSSPRFLPTNNLQLNLVPNPAVYSTYYLPAQEAATGIEGLLSSGLLAAGVLALGSLQVVPARPSEASGKRLCGRMEPNWAAV